MALTVDQLVVQCENCEFEPLITRVEGIKQDDVEVVWREEAAPKLDSKNRRKIDWEDVIPKSSIDFKLTSIII